MASWHDSGVNAIVCSAEQEENDETQWRCDAGGARALDLIKSDAAMCHISPPERPDIVGRVKTWRLILASDRINATSVY